MDTQHFSEVNKKRCDECYHKIEDWSPTDWACALAGEVGELCNFLKKMRRGKNVDIKKIRHEIGDVFTYLDLLSQRLGVDMFECAIEKFNIVSDKFETNIKYEDVPEYKITSLKKYRGKII